ncbi:AraC family transcriptional regulator [Olivibacter sp. SDN3]|uniref:AraC family transcriptional regulator n=1 Tax=Olivibacter sp. SDN3 TaxID=2764720 RepID=UPI0016510BFA|nr:AraC family transcriptional regulator [Olivibacter sp. SDN3]QNL48022.1 AraC family transcriptional regulator [Olivibacter sp. SDN3]
MKPVIDYLPKSAGESFAVRHFDYDFYPTPWHFHPEYELVLVTESTGQRLIGDDISDFKPGDMALIGPNLPHVYRNDMEYYAATPYLRAKSIVVHFTIASFGDSFLSLPETHKIKTLLNKSLRGLEIYGGTNEELNKRMHELVELSDFARWLKLLEMLNILAETDEYKYISKAEVKGCNEKESERMDNVLTFVFNNFKKNISLKEVANIANMAENSFSRYFALRARRSFTKFVNEVRLSHACKLLIEDKLNILEISMECGFNNLSNFNRQFKSRYSYSPMAYRKQLNQAVRNL